MANICAPNNLGKEPKGPGAAITVAIKRMINVYKSMFLATRTLLLLTVSTCGMLGWDTQVFIKTVAVRHVDLI